MELPLTLRENMVMRKGQEWCVYTGDRTGNEEVARVAHVPGIVQDYGPDGQMELKARCQRQQQRDLAL